MGSSCSNVYEVLENCLRMPLSGLDAILLRQGDLTEPKKKAWKLPKSTPPQILLLGVTPIQAAPPIARLWLETGQQASSVLSPHLPCLPHNFFMGQGK